MTKNPSEKELKQFSILIGLIFPLLIGLIIPYLTGHGFRFWTLIIALPVLFLGQVKPILLNKIYKIWMKLCEILGWVNSRLILGLVFVLIIQPTSLIMRLFSYDPLKKKKSSEDSYKEYRKVYDIRLDRTF